ncbi:hypothetical protein ACFSUS_21480 [Spirosoma soli]|uniref:HlyD family efflux transporter periplasmic adaptor subunit n=1 Tax=Spirosoma soli TaxID=1770529 RepID=A0ABW5M9T1_9BACT
MPNATYSTANDDLNLLSDEVQEVLGRRFSWVVRHGNLLTLAAFLSLVALGAIVRYPMTVELPGTMHFVGTIQRIAIPPGQAYQPLARNGQTVQRATPVILCSAPTNVIRASQEGVCIWENVTATQATLCIVPNHQTFDVRCAFPTEKSRYIKLGSPVTISCPAYPDARFKGFVTQRSVQAQGNSIWVNVRFTVSQSSHTLVVPDQANATLRFTLKEQTLLSYVTEALL